ncbi:MAG: hypothetical protein KC422_09280 [Trueperaceae bacterium]|nr:hypothetical protein [Trueperaceae bacterium]
MKMIRYWFLALLLFGTFAHADIPLDGLTLALHPVGETLVVGGRSRTLYTLDASTLEVLNRTYLGTTINKLMFSPDGSLLFVQDSEPDIYILNAETFEQIGTLGGYGSLSMAPDAKLMVALNRDYDGDTLTLFDTNGLEMKSLTFGEDDDVSSLGISPDGSKLAVFFDYFESENEEDVSWSNIPEEYEGFAKDVYAEQHDGDEARYMLLSLPGLEVLADYVSFYSPREDELVFFQGDDALIINSSNENARYSPDGTVEMWAWSSDISAYGSGISADHNILAVGSLADASIMDMANNSEVSFDLDDLPGWPEYFSSFVIAPSGIIYGATDAHRVVKVTQAGAGVSKEIKPIY